MDYNNQVLKKQNVVPINIAIYQIKTEVKATMIKNLKIAKMFFLESIKSKVWINLIKEMQSREIKRKLKNMTAVEDTIVKNLFGGEIYEKESQCKNKSKC